MNARIPVQSTWSVWVIVEPTGVDISRRDLEIAHMTQSIKQDLIGIIGDVPLVSTEADSFNNPEVVQKAIEIQQKYNFQPIWNRTDFSYLTRVISIDDFMKHPDLYFTKLTKWFGSFPLDLDLNYLAQNFLDSTYFKVEWGIFKFQHSPIFASTRKWYHKMSNIASYALNKALINASCWVFHTECYIHIDIFTFLKNYDNLVAFVNWEIADSEWLKNNALKSLEAIKIIAIAMLKTVTNITIKSPHDFFESPKYWSKEIKEALLKKDFNQDKDNPFTPHTPKEEALYHDIEETLLSTATWISKTDIDKLIKLQNPDQFTILVDMLLKKLLSDTKLINTWIKNIKKDIEDYSTEELIALSTFLARYLIDHYEHLDTMVDVVLRGFSPKSLSWKCTDYTGMSLHIINNYLKPRFPHRFANIIVWYDNQNIGDMYKHCYMKIYGYNSAGIVEVTFIDPTKLAGCSMEELKITDDILQSMDASNLPIQINRTAEDIIIAKLREDQNGIQDLKLPESWEMPLISIKQTVPLQISVDTSTGSNFINRLRLFWWRIKNLLKK
jgi:hypothetical protein